MAEVRVGQRVKVRVGVGGRIDGMVARVETVGRSPHGWQWAFAVVDGVGSATLLIPEDIEPDWKPDIPRQAVADLHAAVTKQIQSLESLEALYECGDCPYQQHRVPLASEEVRAFAESLRLLLEGPTDGD